MANMNTAQDTLLCNDRTYPAYATRARQVVHSLHNLSDFPLVAFDDGDQERDIARKLYATASSLDVPTKLFGVWQASPRQIEITDILHRIVDCEVVVQKIEAARNRHAELVQGPKIISGLCEIRGGDAQEILQGQNDAFVAVTVNFRAGYQGSKQ
jgi:hypothetical protein